VSVPFNNLKRGIAAQREQLLDLAAQVLDSGWVVLGPHVQAFEAEFANYCGTDLTAISVANGSDALALALSAAGVKVGDSVVCCANAAMYGSLAILSLGAKPVFVDVRTDHTMCVDDLKRVLANTKPSAIIVTHLYGQLAQIEQIVEIASARGIPVIEDCAQAHGAERSGLKAGSFGRFACFSFYPTKNLGALGDGGAVVCKTAADAKRLGALRQYGWQQKYFVEVEGGRNSRLDELQAAWLRHGLKQLDANNARRREIAQRYCNEINHPKIALPKVGEDHVAHLYVLRASNRDTLKAHLTAHQIGSDIHYPLPDHRQAILVKQYAEISLPRTELDATQVISLPCFPELSDAEVTQVIEVVNAWQPA
jgi:dTDP-4-amino-4,6-dideoxygalactose transaminase